MAHARTVARYTTAIRSSRLSRQTKRVLCAIASYMDETGTATASGNQIADIADCADRTVWNTIARMGPAGILHVTHVAVSGRPNIYRINLDALTSEASTT